MKLSENCRIKHDAYITSTIVNSEPIPINTTIVSIYSPGLQVMFETTMKGGIEENDDGLPIYSINCGHNALQLIVNLIYDDCFYGRRVYFKKMFPNKMRYESQEFIDMLIDICEFVDMFKMRKYINIIANRFILHFLDKHQFSPSAKTATMLVNIAPYKIGLCILKSFLHKYVKLFCQNSLVDGSIDKQHLSILEMVECFEIVQRLIQNPLISKTQNLIEPSIYCSTVCGAKLQIIKEIIKLEPKNVNDYMNLINSVPKLAKIVADRKLRTSQSHSILMEIMRSKGFYEEKNLPKIISLINNNIIINFRPFLVYDNCATTMYRIFKSSHTCLIKTILIKNDYLVGKYLCKTYRGKKTCIYGPITDMTVESQKLIHLHSVCTSTVLIKIDNIPHKSCKNTIMKVCYLYK